MIRTAAKPSKLDQQRALLGAVPKPVTQAVEEVMSGLPALVKAAADKLAGATTAAQVLDAKDTAGLAYDASKRAARVMKAKGAHDQVVAAAHRAQADALEIEAAAKRRLADEYDAGQAGGEIAKAGGDRTSKIPNGKNAPATAAEAGVTSKEIHDARAIRDVIASNPTAVREALDDILAKGDEPTRAALKRAIAPATTAIRADQTAAKKARRTERETILAEKIKALPDEKFGVIVADPEWRFEPYSRETGMDRAADNHYPTSDLDVIKARPVASIAAPDCVLFLWATAPMMPQALDVMAAWGFDYVTQAVWVKQRTGEGRGSGYWFTGEHEILLVGTRGKVVAPAPGMQFPSVIYAPVGEHSAKPVEALEIVEAYFPNLPKIELNRRGPARVGWSAWGQEAESQAKPSEDNGTTAKDHDEVGTGVTGEGSRQRQRRRDGGERPAQNFGRSTGAIGEATISDGSQGQDVDVGARLATATPEKVEDGEKDCNVPDPSSDGGPIPGTAGSIAPCTDSTSDDDAFSEVKGTARPENAAGVEPSSSESNSNPPQPSTLPAEADKPEPVAAGSGAPITNPHCRKPDTCKWANSSASCSPCANAAMKARAA